MMTISIPDTSPLKALMRPFPQESTPEMRKPEVIYGVAGEGDRIAAWWCGGLVDFGYLCAPKSEYEKRQHDSFQRMIWQLCELARLGFIAIDRDPLPSFEEWKVEQDAKRD